MTLENFELEMENASPDKKAEILANAVDTLDLSDEDTKESFQKHKDELSDLLMNLQIAEDIRCNTDIESGTLQLRTCIKSVDNYVAGQDYYTKIDDLCAELKERWSITEEEAQNDASMRSILDRINAMTTLYWVYSDEGIGTFKTKSLFTHSFTEHFK